LTPTDQGSQSQACRERKGTRFGTGQESQDQSRRGQEENGQNAEMADREEMLRLEKEDLEDMEK
jgi:hypothetical protein